MQPEDLENNPFDTTGDLNPFAQVDVYNPFSEPSYQPDLTGTPLVPSSPITPGELKFRDPTYEEVELFYKDDSSVPLDPKTPMNAPPMYPGPPQSSMRTSTGTSRVSVKRSGEETKEDSNDHTSFWQPEYYRRFFNVDSSDVLIRCGRSMWPFKYDFLYAIKDNPDFYGPFWISTTLVFMMAASANFAYYIQTLTDSTILPWNYDFSKFIYGSAVIYGYAFIIPVLFWLYMKWADMAVQLIDILCIYGYSLFVYSPVALLCIIPFDLAKWVVVGVGCLLSTAFLVVNLWLPLREKLAHAIIILIVITLFHIGLALAFRLYFFTYG